MNRKTLTGILGLALLLSGASLKAGDNEKLAQTGMQFLSVMSDARAASLGGAVHTHEGMKSASLFFNPATMGFMENFIDISASQNQWIADINHNAFSLAIRPGQGEWGVIGVSLLAVDYGEMQGTRVDAGNPQGYVDTDMFSPSAMAVGLGYAKALTDRFAVGGQVKIVRQKLGENTLMAKDSTLFTEKNEISPVAFDFGTLFHTGFKSLTFGMSVRNFSPEVKFAEEGFELPLAFTMGLSMNLFDVVELGDINHSLYVAVNATHFRSHPEQVSVGLDYELMDLLSVRLGYASGNDENGVSFGFGVKQFGVAFDYAYTPFGLFDKVQRMTARISL